MISLEQVRALETRVEKAVALIAALRAENASMRSGLSAAEGRVAELEGLVSEFQKDQSRIEQGIIEALRKLDSFEDAVHEAATSGAARPAPAPAAEAASPAEPEPEAAIEPEALEPCPSGEPAEPATEESADALDIF